MSYPMIDALAGTMVLADGHLLAANAPAAAAYFQPTADTMYYEVIRVVDGIPLFWEDHLRRLTDSVAGQFTLPATLYAESLQLIAVNALPAVNLRLVITPNQRVLHLIPSYYPSAAQFARGVPTGLLQWERHDPNVKIIRADYKAAVAARFAEAGPFGPCFELLLADQQGLLTEGSRSNLFFIRGNDVLTAPDSLILKGITRQYVMQAIRTAGGSLVEQMITLADIAAGQVDAAFLSGSPIDLLPISAIETIELPSVVNPLFRSINAAYQAIVQQYLADHQAKK
jgi:branched-chain amino acid aminotransferase